MTSPYQCDKIPNIKFEIPLRISVHMRKNKIVTSLINHLTRRLTGISLITHYHGWRATQQGIFMEGISATHEISSL